MSLTRTKKSFQWGPLVALATAPRTPFIVHFNGLEIAVIYAIEAPEEWLNNYNLLPWVGESYTLFVKEIVTLMSFNELEINQIIRFGNDLWEASKAASGRAQRRYLRGIFRHSISRSGRINIRHEIRKIVDPLPTVHGIHPSVTCAICLDDFFSTRGTAILLPCHRTHYLHTRCLKKWMRRSSTCPLCRQAVVPQLQTPQEN